MKPKFDLGQIVATRGVDQWITEGEPSDRLSRVARCVERHRAGDWGDVDDEDRATNDISVEQGLRIMSVYTVDERTIWIITEADRSVTTLLFPEEY